MFYSFFVLENIIRIKIVFWIAHIYSFSLLFRFFCHHMFRLFCYRVTFKIKYIWIRFKQNKKCLLAVIFSSWSSLCKCLFICLIQEVSQSNNVKIWKPLFNSPTGIIMYNLIHFWKLHKLLLIVHFFIMSIWASAQWNVLFLLYIRLLLQKFIFAIFDNSSGVAKGWTKGHVSYPMNLVNLTKWNILK